MTENNAKQADFSLKETSPNIGGGRAISGGEKLSSSFNLVEQMRFLYVRIVRARSLTPDPNAAREAFMEINIGNFKGRTKFSGKTPNPEFLEVFAFTKDRIQGNVLEIVMRNKEFQNDEMIGKCKFEVAEVPTRVPPDSPLAPQWYRLEDRTGNKIQGEIMLSVWIGTQADEAFPDAWHSDSATITGENVVNTRSKVYLSPRLWYLRVNIIEAQDLVPAQRNRSPECFIKGYLGNIVLRSRISPNKSVNPIWNEDMMFVAVEPFEDTLVLSVEDKVGNKEESLGKCAIKLSQVERRITPNPVAPLWYNIEQTVAAPAEGGNAEVKFAGRIHLRVSLDGGYHVLDESILYSSDYRPSAKLLWPPPIGVLELGILNASGLMPMKSRDGRGTTDAYCVAKYGHKWVRTRTIVDSFVPKWNEQYTWEVFDPYTIVTIGVFDNPNLLPSGNNNDDNNKNNKNNPKQDLRIGKVRIRLSTLETDRIYTHSYPLVVLKPDGAKKMGEIQLAVRFTSSTMIDTLQTYFQPLLPKMHYIHPLSVYQLDSLRHQATHILSLRLGLTEPPLRRDVVEYMLDVGSNVWSLRRGRANFERLLAFFNTFAAAWKRFDGIRKWESPGTTFCAHFAFLLAVLQPQFILIVCFLLCAVNGMWQYLRRPRNPPNMDIKLSKADTSLPDELDEEFDPFPTAKNNDVLKKRYDKLRGIAGRMMMVVGDLATQGERFMNLMSWRDPRATMLFVAFSFVACGLLFVVPVRMLIGFLGFYSMRHPRLRIEMPSVVQNFFRRLPSRADCML